MTLHLLEPRTEPRWPAHSPPRPALTAARPAPQTLPPERCEPAAHASSPAWAAPLSPSLADGEIAESRVAEANAHEDDAAARVARTLCVLVRCAVEHPEEARGLARSFGRSAVAQVIRRDVTEAWALGRFSARELDSAILAALGVVEIAVQRALDCPSDPATPLITRELAFGLLRALGVSDSVACMHARDAALEILVTSH
jgi:hypothetical protein